MCLAIPAKIVEVQGDIAKVDFGQGIVRTVNVLLVEAQVGEYILVHAGYAIQVIDKEAAEETLRLWEEILRHSQS
jgi:hydrogenase expression/formation protein HypC